MRAIRQTLALVLGVATASCGGAGGTSGQADTSPPTVPGGLTATAVSTSQIDLAWAAATDDVGVTGYRLSRNGTLLADPAATSRSDTGLSPSTEYCYTLSARDAAGNVSAQSTPQCATTLAVPAPPTAPTGLTIRAGAGLVVLEWSPVAGAASYNLYMATQPGVTRGTYGVLAGGIRQLGVTSPYGHDGLLNGTTYYFVVTAVDANGESVESTQVSATPQPLPAVTYRLNDTGITASQCYQADDSLVACDSAGALALSDAQDGMVGRDVDVSSSGDGKLGFSFIGLAGGCVWDAVTGLMWEVKTTDGGLRDSAKVYTNYDDTLAAQKRGPGWEWLTPTQAEIDAPTNSVGFAASVNAQRLCGYADWRVPTIDELQSIVDYGAGGAAVDADWFPGTQAAAYWTATSIVDTINTDYFGIHHFTDYAGAVAPGGVYASGVNEGVRDSLHHVRLVRAGPPPTTPRFTVAADGQEVTDELTGLVWRRCAEGLAFDGLTCSGAAMTLFTHRAALQHAAGEAAGSGLAWRVPNIKELSSLVDRRFFNPPVDPAVFPNTLMTVVWSATPYLGNTRYLAWGINFAAGGDVYGYERVNGGSGVRLVRSGP